MFNKGIKMNLSKFKLLPLTVSVAAILSPMTAAAVDAPEDFKFSGYARYGLHASDDAYTHDYGNYTGSDSLIKLDRALTGNSAGRLGNEGNGGEIQFTKGLLGPNDTVWKIGFMVDHWSDNVHFKKIFASVTNVFESQPNATLWAGRDFHQRPQTQLADFFIMTHDGQGAGVKDLDLGWAKLDLGAVGAVADGVTGATDDTYLYGNSTNDSGNYAITSKLHDIALGDSISLSVLANYGFSTDDKTDPGSARNDGTKAYQIATIFDSNWSKGSNQLAIRYSDNAYNSVFTKTEDMTDLYAGLEGSYYATQNFGLMYAIAYADHTEANDSEDRSEYSAIIRPMYSWNDIHSTWFEFGTSLADYDNGGKNTAWKATISQNISIDAFGFGRPMLRFYANIGQSDNKATQPTQGEVDVFAVGAMFEAWW